MHVKHAEQIFLDTYDQYADDIFRFCFFKLLDKEKAEEVTQEAFVRTWDYLAQGKKIENIRAFVYRVAKNIIVDSYRKKKEISLDVLREQGFDAFLDTTESQHDILDGGRVIAVIQQMDERFRDVLLLRYVNSLPVKEIALIIGETENHVSVKIHRGLKQLKRLLDPAVRTAAKDRLLV